MRTVSIRQIQGGRKKSALAGKIVQTTGLVTGVLRRGFFLQTPNVDWDGHTSDAVFVYSTNWTAEQGTVLEVTGEVLDYLKHETAKTVTQVHLERARVLANPDSQGRVLKVAAIKLTRECLPRDNAALATFLNGLTAMLVRIEPGQTFIAPSNRHGDYVIALDEPQTDRSMPRTTHQGCLIDAENPLRWYPGFRVSNYNHAPRLNVGAKLLSEIRGPMNYRVDADRKSVV